MIREKKTGKRKISVKKKKKKKFLFTEKSPGFTLLVKQTIFQNFQVEIRERDGKRREEKSGCFNFSQGNRNFSNPWKIREVVTRDKGGWG